MAIARKLMSGMFNGLAAAKLDLDAKLKSYIETALWSSSDNADESGGEPLDKNYGINDLAPKAVEKMRRDVNKFFEENAKDIELAASEGQDGKQVAHDFWLTRNGHGAGFWDGDYSEELGNRLTAAAEKFGEQDIVIGDDGKLYAE